MDENFIYWGLFLEDIEREKLISFFKEKYDVLKNKNINIYLNHCTLFFKTDYKENKDIYNSLKREFESNLSNFSKKYPIKITKIGWSDKACAFGCEVSLPCVNKQPHITICTFNNSKPFESNNIVHWEELEPFFVMGTLDKEAFKQIL